MDAEYCCPGKHHCEVSCDPFSLPCGARQLTNLLSVQKPDLKTLLAGRIARAAAVFCVDEIVIFDDDPSTIPNYIDTRYRGRSKSKEDILSSIDEADQPWQYPDLFLYHVLSYAECPPYIRMDAKDSRVSLFLQHQNLKWVGLLPSLDMPHHMKSHEWCQYREGVSLGPANPKSISPSKSKLKKSKAKQDASNQQQWTYVKCGLPYPVKIPFKLDPATRVTLKFTDAVEPPSWPNLSKEECETLGVDAVAPSAPREEEGYYWGYNVRRATSLTNVLAECEFENGYDVTIGTSERGVPLTSVLPDAIAPRSPKKPKGVGQLPSEFKHLLIVFGGVAGLEPAVASDPELSEKGLTKETASELFDAWVNLVQGQGSRTIRTEEAVEFGLFGLKPYVDSLYE